MLKIQKEFSNTYARDLNRNLKHSCKRSKIKSKTNMLEITKELC